MCFSATASFAASGVLGGTGIAILKRIPRALYPAAAIPFMFALHQLIEGIQWILPEMSSASFVFAFFYMLISHVFWPSYVPFAVRTLEPQNGNPYRKIILLVFQTLGLSVSIILLTSMLQHGVHVNVLDHHLNYLVPTAAEDFLLFGYIFAVVGSFFSSSHSAVRWFGIIILISLIIAQALFALTFASVWCFFAAIISFSIYIYILRNPQGFPKKTKTS